VTTRFGAGLFDIAADGTLVYQPRSARPAARTLVWVDRQGREEAAPIPPRPYVQARLSPDGKRVALDVLNDIWIWEIGRDTLTRLTIDQAADRFPVWLPDGRRLVFGSERTSNGMANLFLQSADGSGSVERLTDSPNQQFPMSVSPDGATLVFRESAPSLDLTTMSLAQPKQPARSLLNTSAAEQNGEVSPDGRWLAYQSNESGRFEIYVRPFPNVDAGRWQISTDGGMQVVWSRNGQELFYLGLNGGVMTAAVGTGTAWSNGTPAKLFDDPYFHGNAAGVGRSYDVTPDGRRFLMIKQRDGSDSQEGTAFVVVQNWHDELKRLAPGK
jgi:eukaryotic-like serine/threonine-protein kinase